MSSSKREALIEECMAYDAVLHKYGQSLGGVALQSLPTAKTLRSKGGKALVTDGPYAESKELLGGVAINRFIDIDRAVEAWSKHPALRVGDVLEKFLAPIAHLTRAGRLTEPATAKLLGTKARLCQKELCGQARPRSPLSPCVGWSA